MKYSWLVAAVMLAAVVIATSGCETTSTQEGAVIGGALGAGAGAIIGNQSHGRTGEGALIGGAVGAISGALVGDQVDKRRGVRGNTVTAPAPAPAPAPVAPPPQRGHYETRLVTAPNGETYEERVWVQGR